MIKSAGGFGFRIRARLVLNAAVVSLALFSFASGQAAAGKSPGEIIQKAIKFLGGDQYLAVRTQVGRGRFTIMQEGVTVSSQSFVDVIVFPDRERTDFKGGARSVQVNDGRNAWLYDGEQDRIKEQTQTQLDNFRRGLRTSLDGLLRGYWSGAADLSYVGRRASAILGKRNDVVRLTFKDGFAVDFEFADDGTPVKSIYKRTSAAGEEIAEEDRFAQFISINGVKTPFIIDRYSAGKPTSRINYDSVEFNKAVPDSIFSKPATAKQLKNLNL